MRICVDCGTEQEEGEFCKNCGKATFERTHTTYENTQTKEPNKISSETQKKPTTVSKGLIKVLIIGAVFIVFIAILGAILGVDMEDGEGTGNTTTTIPHYTIASVENVSYANVIRKNYRVRVQRVLTKNELLSISQKIVRQATSDDDIDAIMLFFYLPDSDTNGAYTAGKVTWAPGGDWGKASTNLFPEYVIEVGSALGSMPEEDIVDLPIGQKKQIFYESVRYEDMGLIISEAHSKVAEQFGITEEQASKIGLEGVVNGWPMPEL